MSTPLFTQEEWERLLAPITEQVPTGEPLIYEGTYDNIREARREDDATLPRNEWDTELKKADWPQVYKLCLKALTTQTKDIQITIWLTEALLHLHSYLGLQTGLQLLFYLCERYWKTLFPALEEDDVTSRVAPFFWLNHDKFILKLGTLPMTQPQSADALPYHLFHYESARALEELPVSQKEAAVAAGRPTKSKFFSSAALTPLPFYTSLAKVLEISLHTLEQLDQFLTNHCGKEAPSLSKLRQRLMEANQLTLAILKERPLSPNQETESIPQKAGLELSAKEEVQDHRGPSRGPIQNRREAYQRLAEIAEYLQQIEPHSPTPYLIRRAISWGDMSLTDLLLELVNDERDLIAIYSLLGIKKPPKK